MNKRQRKKRVKQMNVRLAERLRDPKVLQKLGEIGAGFIWDQLRRPYPSSPRVIKPGGEWKDGLGVVHAVNFLVIGFTDEIDLGRETACGSTFWNPDEPWLYPDLLSGEVDCMACVATRNCA
jgi:hypothetical protein